MKTSKNKKQKIQEIPENVGELASLAPGRGKNLPEKNPLTKKVEKILGHCSRMIGGSKGQYRYSYPNNITVFNANICTASGKIWYGDLDLTEDSWKLVQAAKAVKEPIYVLYEMDARFENENKPLLDKAVAVIDKGLVNFPVTYLEPEWFYEKDGKPYHHTHEEMCKLYPDKYKEHVWVYEKKNYVAKKLKKPISAKDLNLKKSDDAILDKIGEYLISCGVPAKTGVYLTEKQYEEVEKILINYLKKQGLAGYGIQRELNWFPLYVDFSGFQKTPEWASENCYYIRKKNTKD